jgi:uncharacterized membrane protein HdeD (DUF308 family)/predicted flap endonuclease-1-like 5' DNA nuclease
VNTATYNTTPRWLSIVLGIASIIFGWLIYTNPGVSLLAIAILLGMYFIVIGIVQIIGIFTGAAGSKIWKLVSGILAIIAGVLLLGNQVIGAAAVGMTFNFLIAFFAIITGIALLIDGFTGGGCLAVIFGILGIVLGVLLLFNPLQSLLTLPRVIGLLAIFGGIMAIIGAIFRPSPPPPPTRMAAPTPPLAPPKVDVTKATGAVAATTAVAAATARDVSGDVVKATDAAVDAAGDAVTGAAAVAAAKASDAGEWVAEKFGAEDAIDWAKYKLDYSGDSLSGLSPDLVEKLKAAEVSKPGDLLQLAANPAGRAKLAKATGVPEAVILRWVNQLDLRRVKGIGEAYADLLETAGVDTIAELAQRNPANLLNRITAVNAEHGLVVKLPSLTEVEDWIRQAKELPRIVTY